MTAFIYFAAFFMYVYDYIFTSPQTAGLVSSELTFCLRCVYFTALIDAAHKFVAIKSFLFHLMIDSDPSGKHSSKSLLCTLYAGPTHICVRPRARVYKCICIISKSCTEISKARIIRCCRQPHPDRWLHNMLCYNVNSVKFSTCTHILKSI